MIQQALRIVWKDFREHRVPLLLFVGLVFLATWSSATEQDGSFLVVFLPSGVALMMMVIGAVFVQGDSPFNDHAYWRRLPINGEAVALGKLAGFALTTVPPLLIGELIALTQLGVQSPDAWHYATSILFRQLLGIMSVMIIAAATPSFKAFAGSYIAYIAVQTLVGSQETIRLYRLHATHLDLAQWIDAVIPIVGLIAFVLCYVNAWTTVKGRLVAATSTFALPLVVLAIGLSVTKIAVDSGPYRSLPSSNTTLSLDGDRFTLRIAIRAPDSNETVRLQSPRLRVKSADGQWYRLSFDTRGARQENAMSKEELRTVFGMPIDKEFQNDYQRLEIVGDSVYLSLTTPVDRRWMLDAADRGASFHLTGSILRQRRVHTFRYPVDSFVSLGASAHIRFAEDYFRDSVWTLRLKGRSVGRDGNPVAKHLLGGFGTVESELFRMLGYSGPNIMQDTAFVISTDSADTVLMRYANNGRGGGREKPLPISGSLINDVEVDIAPIIPVTTRERPNWVGNSHIVLSTTEFAGYTPLRARLRLQIPQAARGGQR